MAKPTRPPIRIAIVGVGKIARDEHLPALRANPRFELAATVSPNSSVEDAPAFPTLEALLHSPIEADAVSICTPPQQRHAIARAAIGAGLHLMLEKPPGATVSEVQDLAAQAKKADVTLFASWHSREAAGVNAAREWLKDRRILSVRTIWREDIRVWHPGQEWILNAGGLGVFDPGVNALSILTHILPDGLRVRAAELIVPANRESPIAARLDLAHGDGAPVSADFDFRETGRQRWEIEIETDEGAAVLSEGGAAFSIAGRGQDVQTEREYPRLYHRFARLIETGKSDADASPLQLVADAFLIGRKIEDEAFFF